MADNNLYPAAPPRARRRGKRKPRPAHLPPWEPETLRPDHEARAKKQLAATPAPIAFGAKRGAGNALLFHALKNEHKLAGPPPAGAPAVPDDDDDDDGDDDDDA